MAQLGGAEWCLRVRSLRLQTIYIQGPLGAGLVLNPLTMFTPDQLKILNKLY